jgi:hypothetical protein
MPRYVSNSVWLYDMARKVISFSVVLTLYAREGEGQRGPVLTPHEITINHGTPGMLLFMGLAALSKFKTLSVSQTV